MVRKKIKYTGKISEVKAISELSSVRYVNMIYADGKCEGLQVMEKKGNLVESMHIIIEGDTIEESDNELIIYKCFEE